MNELYNKQQYRFLYDLWCRGYTRRELAEWAGTCHETLQKSFIRHGFTIERCDRPPLSQYTDEFNKLGTVI